MINNALLKKIEIFVTDLVTKIQSNNKYYHGMEHTLDVVKISKEIAVAEGMLDDELEMIIIAAWFHDTGYFSCNDGHELQSSKYASDFLNKEFYPSDKILSIIDCIQATKIPQNPKNKLEEILCDADLHHLGLPDIDKKGALLRKELKEEGIKDFSDIEWYRMSYEFLNNHHFFTDYANKKFNAQKNMNLKKIELKIRNLEAA